MNYQISERLISRNRSYQPLSPQGFVIHATDDQGATDENEQNYFNSGDRKASAHYFADWDSITRTVPESERAWHAGPTANSKFLSVEMCEPTGNDPAKFQEVWKRTVWLVADACVRYGWNTKDNVFSHRGISAMYHETSHTDPIGFLAQYAKTWADLLAAIDAEIRNIRNPKQERTDIVENLVIYSGEGDLGAAFLLRDKLRCPMIPKEYITPELLASVKNKHLVGGPNDIQGAIFYSGANRYETAKNVLK